MRDRSRSRGRRSMRKSIGRRRELLKEVELGGGGRRMRRRKVVEV